jgi:class 3 adenylate cyclase
MLIVMFAYQALKKERRKSEELLLNILPRETKEELEKFGKAIPKEHASATIMFCDVQGFTNISVTMGAEKLVNMIDFYFRKFDEIMTRNELEKIKTIGDAYMCAGGLHHSESAKDHASRTIDAAIEIMKFAVDAAPEMKEKYGSSFSFRIGVHTGSVVSGVVGSKKYAYDIWGDTVNTAARMEQSSMGGHINISGDTYKLVEGKYHIDYRGKINAKHKGELDMYFIRWHQ